MDHIQQSLGGPHGKGVDGLFEKVSFQTAFEGVKSGRKSDVKRLSISDCRSPVTKRSFTKFSGETRQNRLVDCRVRVGV